LNHRPLLNRLGALVLGLVMSVQFSCAHDSARNEVQPRGARDEREHASSGHRPDQQIGAPARDLLPVDIIADIESQQGAANTLRDVGAEDVKELRQHGLTGVEIVIVGVIAATALGNLVIRLSQLWTCGSVVDSRGTRVMVKSTCDIPRGHVVLVAPDGVETKLERPTELSIGEILSSVRNP
jgi:hypothetical protein